MTQPAQSALPKQRILVYWEGQHETGPQRRTLSFHDRTRIRRIQLCADDTGVVDCHLCFTVSMRFIHTRIVRRARIVAAFPILLSISVSKERLSVMVEPWYLN